MTVKLVTMYAPPGDASAFDEYYFGTHVPLVARLPGLQRTETCRIISALDGGEQTFYRVTELYFEDQAAMEAAFGSDEGKATSRDYRQIAPPGSRMFAAEADG